MIRTKSFAVAVIVIGLAACSGSAKVAAPTTVGTTAPPASATTTPATVAPTTAPSTTTATTVAPTTLPPATTAVASPMNDPDALKETIKQAAIKGHIVDIHECLVAPLTCDPSQITAVQGTARAILTRNIGRFIASGERSTTNEADPSYLSVTNVEIDPERTRAVVRGCWWDTAVRLIPGGNADGSDKIVNDEKASQDTRLTLVLEDGRWLIELVEILNTTTGSNTCPPK